MSKAFLTFPERPAASRTRALSGIAGVKPEQGKYLISPVNRNDLKFFCLDQMLNAVIVARKAEEPVFLLDDFK